MTAISVRRVANVSKRPTKRSLANFRVRMPNDIPTADRPAGYSSLVSRTYGPSLAESGSHRNERKSASCTGNESAHEDTWKSIALVNRLLEVEDRVQSLASENLKLKQSLAAENTHSSTGGMVFDVPQTTYAWPMAENSKVLPEDLGMYDCRCDDRVVVAGRDGERFFTQYKLLSNEPDFHGAVAAINSAGQNFLIGSSREDAPDVSIVIPIYGQLAYTLNCLQSLVTHKSQYTAEIIVIDDASPDNSGELLSLVKCTRLQRRQINGGFIQSCNMGGEIALGRFIVILNNDTRVTDGWLDELIGGFKSWPNAGLVGSKMHYADGSLQEAGGIIWRDGSAWNYGRNDDPNRPQYSYAREADYISGCSIALPITLWRNLGGFDEFYRPAYCEDVDLAFRVRSRGREVWFQPQSRIIHYEGRSSGTSTAGGVKAYQIVNTKKLFHRWREPLMDHRLPGEAPFFERERSVRKRLLLVDITTPTPDQDAGSVQTFMALRASLALGYKTHFVPEDNWLFQPKYTSAMQAIGVDCAFAPYEIGLENYFRRYGWLFDVVLVHRVGAMEKVLPLARRYAPGAVVLFQVVDLHYLRMERTAQISGDSNMHCAASIMKERELSLVRQVDCTMSPSSVELELLAAEAPRCPLALSPLLFEFFGTKRTFTDRCDLCFLGGYRHAPNVDAVLYFVKEIFPLIRLDEPNIRFIIAGAHPPEEVRHLAGNGVVVTGMVENLQDLFDPCRVFVCPLRIGAGVKGKIASALSYGIPIVSTGIGTEGTELKHGKHVLVADDPAGFAKEVIRLYRDSDLWGTLSKAGQDLVQRTLSLEAGKKVLARSIEIAFARKLGLDATNVADG